MSLDNYETPQPNYRDVMTDREIIRLPDVDQTNTVERDDDVDRIEPH